MPKNKRVPRKVDMDNNKEEKVLFTNEPKLLNSLFSIEAESPLWKALEGNYEAQNQLREMIEKIFPYPQSPVSEDGEPLFFVKHPRPSFFRRIFQMIKAIFVRPKFPKEALEPAETLVFNDTWLIDGKEYTFQDRQNLYNFMLERGIIKEKPEKTIEDLKNEKK